MKSNFDVLYLEITGESHSEKLGLKLGGIPAGESIDFDAVRRFMLRRKSSGEVWSTPRREPDDVKFISGIENGFSTGGVIEAEIENLNVKSKDYNDVLTKPRPSHADYAAYLRDGAISTGGGRFSGRMTAPLCVAGAIAEQILNSRGIRVYAYVSSVGGIYCSGYEQCVCEDALSAAVSRKLPLIDESREEEIVKAVASASAEGDSLGGSVECVILGLPAGKLGDALFEGLEGKIAYSAFAVPAVKGIEFGAGFKLADMRGSEANDCFRYENDGSVITESNLSGGINGGICNGMPLTFRVAIRPTPSISKPQKSVDLELGENCELSIKGRHDACIVPRAVPAIESAAALAILDELLKRGQIK